jgi:uncharacterized protein (TIGR02246 family)
MKLVILTFMFLGFTAGTAQHSAAQEQPCAIATVNQAIRDIVETWKSGYNSADPEKVASLYAPDATYLTQHFVTGVVHGRAAIKSYVKKGTDAHYRIESIRLLASGCSGDFAYAVTRYDSTNADQKAFGVNLVVLQKIEGKWLIVAHESAVPDTATAIQSLESSTAPAHTER